MEPAAGALREGLDIVSSRFDGAATSNHSTFAQRSATSTGHDRALSVAATTRLVRIAKDCHQFVVVSRVLAVLLRVVPSRRRSVPA
jgi:hypothetical protein